MLCIGFFGYASSGGDVFMYIEYLCKSWQDLLTAVKGLVVSGYFYYTVIELPSQKEDRFKQIDIKLIHKYKALYQKDVYYRRKIKGLANFRYVRFGNIAVILHTAGTIITTEKIKELEYLKNRNDVKSVTNKGLLEGFRRPELEKYCIEYDDRFSDVRKTPINLKITEQVSFNIQFLSLPNPKNEIRKLENEISQLEQKIRRLKNQKNKKKKKKKPVSNKFMYTPDQLIQKKKDKIRTLKAEEQKSKKEGVTVKLTKESYRDIKIDLSILAEQKDKKAMIAVFEHLNGFPPHRGILEQQWEIRKHALAVSKKHGVPAFPSDFFVKNRKVSTRELYHKIDIPRQL